MIAIQRVQQSVSRSRLAVSGLKRFLSNTQNEKGTNMSERLYWDKFYKKHNKTPFEWIIDTSSINEILDQIDSSKKNVEHKTLLFDVGCGTSMFSSRLSSSLCKPNHLVCGDFSRQALEILKSNNALANNNIDFVQCDCKNLPFRENIFDLILDKGYLDSLLKKLFISTNQDAISESVGAMSNLLDKLKYVNKLDKRKYLIQITDETPELRISLFDQLEIQVEYFFKEISVGEDSVYYAYFIRKA